MFIQHSKTLMHYSISCFVYVYFCRNRSFTRYRIRNNANSRKMHILLDYDHVHRQSRTTQGINPARFASSKHIKIKPAVLNSISQKYTYSKQATPNTQTHTQPKHNPRPGKDLTPLKNIYPMCVKQTTKCVQIKK